jgi:hypothetical protein
LHFLTPFLVRGRLGAHRPPENRRQVERWGREALRDLRDRRVRPAMTACLRLRALTAYGLPPIRLMSSSLVMPYR